MPKTRLKSPALLGSCPRCRALVSIDENGVISDPIFGRRAALRKQLEKARCDGPPRQQFRDGWGAKHACCDGDIARAKAAWNGWNRSWPWLG